MFKNLDDHNCFGDVANVFCLRAPRCQSMYLGGANAAAAGGELEPPKKAEPADLVAFGAALDKAGEKAAAAKAAEAKSKKAEEAERKAPAQPTQKAAPKKAPPMPKDGEQISYMGGTVRAKETKFVVRVPRTICKTGKEFTVDRVYGGDAEAAYKGCLVKIASLV